MPSRVLNIVGLSEYLFSPIVIKGEKVAIQFSVHLQLEK